ncbi:MAG: PhaM family polyhydroxyalkanoate granule multifunctional regulatory protein [Burkholderiaceae bacterium]
MKTTSDFSSMGFGPGFEGMDPAQLMKSFQTLQQSWLAAAAGDRPGAAAGIEDLDKRIRDLKAVEQWLSMNLTMLQTTVQGLQMQRTTLANLNEMGNAWQNTAGPSSDASRSGTQAPSAQPPEIDPMAFWNSLQQQFESVARAALAVSAGNQASQEKHPGSGAGANTKNAGDQSTSKPTPGTRKPR